MPVREGKSTRLAFRDVYINSHQRVLLFVLAGPDLDPTLGGFEDTTCYRTELFGSSSPFRSLVAGIEFGVWIFGGPGKPSALDRVDPAERPAFQRTGLRTALDAPTRFRLAVHERRPFVLCVQGQGHLLCGLLAFGLGAVDIGSIDRRGASGAVPENRDWFATKRVLNHAAGLF